jgi:hypothetical protein
MKGVVLSYGLHWLSCFCLLLHNFVSGFELKMNSICNLQTDLFILTIIESITVAARISKRSIEAELQISISLNISVVTSLNLLVNPFLQKEERKVKILQLKQL